MSLERCQLCTRCNQIVRANVQAPALRCESTTIQALRTSSTSCVLCRIFLQSNLKYSESILLRYPALSEVVETFPISFKLTTPQTSDASLLWITVTTLFEDNDRGFSDPSRFIIQICPINAPCAKEAYWSANVMSKNLRLLMMKKWLEGCRANHLHCGSEHHKLPRRLISVGSSMEPCMKLISTEVKEPTSIQYATLSHCWGKTQVASRTVKANLASNLENILMNDLPLSFRDAIAIVRSLDIGYLWIDSLCIIQDDIHDWRSEVADMSDIFFGSTLTIAACDAEDSNGGFFAHPTATVLKEETVQGTVRFISEGFGDEPDLIIQVESQGNSERASPSILHRRGWTLQEAVLSHRLVQFTHSKLHWRCTSAYWTESGMTHDLYSEVHGSLPCLIDVQLSDPTRAWWTWVESYSRRNLTVESDRMPAIYGLIRYYQKMTGDSSALGLWQRSLPRDLLWRRDSILIRAQTTFGDSVPTWSWLSCPTGVRFDNCSSHSRSTEPQSYIKIHECELSWTGEPFLSDVKTSKLIISGPAKEIFLAVAPESRNNNPSHFVVDDEDLENTESVARYSCTAAFDREQERSPGTFLCILGERVHDSSGNRKEAFLILEPTSNSAENQAYSRIGFGMFRGQHDRFSDDVRKTVHLV